MDNEGEELDTVPYSDQNKASFYRQPGGIKKQIKIQQKEMGMWSASFVVYSIENKIRKI